MLAYGAHSFVGSGVVLARPNVDSIGVELVVPNVYSVIIADDVAVSTRQAKTLHNVHVQPRWRDHGCTNARTANCDVVHELLRSYAYTHRRLQPVRVNWVGVAKGGNERQAISAIAWLTVSDWMKLLSCAV